MLNKKKVLFICTGNACRSQIAHGLLLDMAPDQFDVFSAGSHPSRVHPMSIAIMEEVGICSFLYFVLYLIVCFLFTIILYLI